MTAARPHPLRRLALWLLARAGFRVRMYRTGRAYSAVVTPEQYRKVGAL